MKNSLKTIKLLARSSKNIEKIAYYYAMEGKLAEFSVLLTVAREKVLVPITLSRQDEDGWDGSVTLLQCLENTMGSLFCEEYRMGSFVEPEFHRKKLLLRAIAILLQVFERAGNAIEEYIQLERHNSKHGKRCVEAGFRLNEGNIAFSMDDRMNSSGVPPHSPLLPEWNSLSRKGINPGNGYGFARPTYLSKRTHSFIPISIFGTHYSTHSDVQVNNQKKTVEQGFPKYLSREKLAYILMLIKKGIRSA
ncbi:hypothetical protein RHSIM_Rhsim03G0097700 [Rhododendron simsii]|uniref:Uncharacterized protein n=1 Tax=Rhododendron simsii TaxID=118357 RepID=A0A834H825_RHOSS|nr:hypothetical protein RHSIM_Rhsim03G0097700 [Rhododendron simsii]